MRVLLAGASGAIGMPLIQLLHARGHDERLRRPARHYTVAAA